MKAADINQLWADYKKALTEGTLNTIAPLKWRPHRGEPSINLQVRLSNRTPAQLELDKSLTTSLVYGSITMDEAVEKGLSQARRIELSDWAREEEVREKLYATFCLDEARWEAIEDDQVYELDDTRGYPIKP